MRTGVRKGQARNPSKGQWGITGAIVASLSFVLLREDLIISCLL